MQAALGHCPMQRQVMPSANSALLSARCKAPAPFTAARTHSCSWSHAAWASASQLRSRSTWRVRSGQEEQQQPSGPVTVDDNAPSPASSTKGNSDIIDSSSNIPKKRRQAESTDAVASFLSRRFGLAGGLAWLGVLAVGSLGEQVKTRMEVAAEKGATKDVTAAKEITTSSGLKYTDVRIGGGQRPEKGYLVVLDYTAKANGQVFEDTKARGKPIVFIFGSRPLSGGMCPGAEEALSGMRAGGRRRVTVPAALGFGERGAVLRPTEHVPDKQGVVPPGAELEYDLELVRVSVPPS